MNQIPLLAKNKKNPRFKKQPSPYKKNRVAEDVLLIGPGEQQLFRPPKTLQRNEKIYFVVYDNGFVNHF